MDYLPFHFIDASIEVEFDVLPLLEKKPTCPDRFIWEGKKYTVIEMLAEWQDFRRRGRMGRNMQEEHARTASIRGSRGVGRFFFRVRVENQRVFDLYYDRAVVSAGDQKGHWFIHSERAMG